MKAFCITTSSNGQFPVAQYTDAGVQQWVGWNHIGSIASHDAWLVSGTAAQLIAINAVPGVIGLCAMTESGNVRWAELDGNLPAALRTRLNTWLTARGYPTIPIGWTYRQTVVAIFKRLNALWDLNSHDIMSVPGE